MPRFCPTGSGPRRRVDLTVLMSRDVWALGETAPEAMARLRELIAPRRDSTASG